MISIHAAPWQATSHAPNRGPPEQRPVATVGELQVRRAIHPRAMLLVAAAPTARKTVRAPPVVPFALAPCGRSGLARHNFCICAPRRSSVAPMQCSCKNSVALVKVLKCNRNPKGNSNRPGRLCTPWLALGSLGSALNLRSEPPRAQNQGQNQPQHQPPAPANAASSKGIKPLHHVTPPPRRPRRTQTSVR